jgi:hypothetical protein
MIEIIHNSNPDQFMWLWAKYVTGFNEKYHCTNCIRGHYSRKFSKNNPKFARSSALLMDEQALGSYRAIYICGVSKHGYSKKTNYAHNVHVAICPDVGATEEWMFEEWTMRIRNGRLLPIPAKQDNLPVQYRGLPDEYTTCRIFRWSACLFCSSGIQDETST